MNDVNKLEMEFLASIVSVVCAAVQCYPWCKYFFFCFWYILKQRNKNFNQDKSEPQHQHYEVMFKRYHKI